MPEFKVDVCKYVCKPDITNTQPTTTAEAARICVTLSEFHTFTHSRIQRIKFAIFIEVAAALNRQMKE